MSATAEQLASRLVSGGRAVVRADRVGVQKACLAGKSVLLASAAGAGLSPGDQLSGAVNSAGTTRRRSLFRVVYRVRGVEFVVGVLFMRGPVHLLNNDTSPHEIAPRRKKALAFPDGEVRLGPVQHPGTTGKKFFERAEPVIIAQSRRIITQEVRGELARVFAG